jgi:SAM-dependent methyltransferase
METLNAMDCPICSSVGFDTILELDCGGFDGSMLYRTVQIDTCKDCGHVFNRLNSREVAGLGEYYNQEYASLNLASLDREGDRPGSININSTRRYTQLYEFMQPFVKKEYFILDVGCAMGGYLEFLYWQGFKKLFGIDMTMQFVDYANKSKKYIVKFGNAEAIPFGDKSFDCLVIDQVVEHLVNPLNAFREAGRALKKGGLLFVAVPDASRYDEIYFFDYYWFLMREHIQHFDLRHLNLLAELEGFEMLACKQKVIPMMSDKMILPNLILAYRFTGTKKKIAVMEDDNNLSNIMKKYVSHDFKRMKKKKVIISEMNDSKKKPIYAWGIGREFLYLYEAVGLKENKALKMIDTNPLKRETLSLDGKRISDQTILKEASRDSILLITAIAHTNQIREALEKIGYEGDVIEF